MFKYQEIEKGLNHVNNSIAGFPKDVNSNILLFLKDFIKRKPPSEIRLVKMVLYK